MTNYTFTFPKDEEGKFRRIMERLDESEYQVVSGIEPIDKENPRYSELQTVMEMDPEAALTFRMGMKELKIRRARTEEELAAEKEIEERNTVKITVIVPKNETE